MNKFKINYYKIDLEHQKFQPFQKVRIVLLCDLHNQVYGLNNDLLVQRIKEQKPDLIIVGGDLLDAGAEQEEAVALSLLRRLALEYPVYYANGNHEYRMKLDVEHYGLRYQNYAKSLRAAGVHLLENESAYVSIKGLPMQVYGLELPWRFYRRISREKLSVEEIRRYLGKAGARTYNLLIAHNPMCFPAYVQWGADLTVSGHLHGGFLRLPLIGGVISPQFHLFPEYDKGLFTENGQHLIVSAGIGTHAKMPRFGNPSEIVVIDLD